MKKILALCFFPAFAPPKSGGELRLLNLYRELGRWYEVVLLTSTHHGGTEERVQHGSRFVERRIPKDDAFMQAWQQLQSHAGDGDLSGISVGFAARHDTAMSRAYLEEYDSADIIIHEFPFTVDYDLFIGLDSKTRVYNSHNCESELVRQLHPGPNATRLHELVEHWERRLLQHANLVTYCSETDLRGFEALLGRTITEPLEMPNGLAPMPERARTDDGADTLRAIFVASAHLPNVEASLFIAQTLAPRLPTIIFDIVGNCLPQGAYAPNVVRHGTVDAQTKQRLLDAADIALNPMVSGSGSNLKLLEFFSNSLPVVSTPFGARGYPVVDGQQCLIAPMHTFADSVERLAADRALRGTLGQTARQFAESRYSWLSVCTRLHERLQTMRPPAAGLLDEPFVLGMNDYDPFTGSGGGTIRIRGLYEAVDARQPVVYLCFGDTHLSVKRFAQRSVVINVPKTAAHLQAQHAANSRFWISVSDILAIEHAPLNPTLVALYRLLRRRAAIVTLDHPYMASLPASHGDSFVYSSQNYETELKRRMLEHHPDCAQHVRLVERCESMAIESSSCVVAVADEEAQELLSGRQQGAPVVVVRNGASIPAAPELSDVQLAASCIGTADAVFMGSAHAPNVESAQFIVGHLAPALPDVQFHLVGACALDGMQPPPNVRLWGRVSDSLKSAILDHCTVAVNPMFSGSGSNIKVADFIAHGLHVVSTPFGRRGYPVAVDRDVTMAEREDFAAALHECIRRPALNSPEARQSRRALFDRELSMRSLGDRFADLLLQMQQNRPRVLFVTYRWMWPVRGGGEASLLQHLSALVAGGFSVDVVAPDVSAIRDEQRFVADYEPCGNASAPVNLPHVRFRRFPVEPQLAAQKERAARRIWACQPRFERAVYRRLPNRMDLDSSLAWGWTWPGGQHTGRWAMVAFGVHLQQPAAVRLVAHSPQAAGLFVLDEQGRQLAQVDIDGAVDLTVRASAGEVQFELASGPLAPADARPLGLYVHSLTVDGQPLDLMQAQIVHRPFKGSAIEVFENLHAAAVESRSGLAGSLTAARGPHSPQLEAFVREQAGLYDLVLTHNLVFQTATCAITAAREAGTPVVMLPHAHLDDDFYHFPADTALTAQADLVGAVPRAACEFYRRRGARRVAYVAPGCDTSESYSAEDEAAFRAVCPTDKPFILVLGRKAGAKGYRSVVAAVEKVAEQHRIEVILIGPDDDQLPLASAHARYLGPQPRQVVRGALRCCVALANMSVSESFGMVLLESWLAGRPVIVNRHCAAFQDLAVHGHNALLTDESDLADAIVSLLLRPGFALELAAAGRQTALAFDAQAVNRTFVQACHELIKPRCRQPGA